jgi:hypothetical protein
MEDANIYVVNPAQVLVTGEVENGPIKAFILAEIAEKLSRLGGAHHA